MLKPIVSFLGIACHLTRIILFSPTAAFDQASHAFSFRRPSFPKFWSLQSLEFPLSRRLWVHQTLRFSSLPGFFLRTSGWYGKACWSVAGFTSNTCFHMFSTTICHQRTVCHRHFPPVFLWFTMAWDRRVAKPGGSMHRHTLTNYLFICADLVNRTFWCRSSIAWSVYSCWSVGNHWSQPPVGPAHGIPTSPQRRMNKNSVYIYRHTCIRLCTYIIKIV